MSDVNAQLEELFPELQGLLDQWDGNPTPRTNGNGFENENGVEPSEIERALQQRMTAMPQFQSGQTAPPPPPAHVEDGGPSAPQPQPVQPPAEPAQPAPAPESRQEPAGTPPPAPTPDEVVIGQDDEGNPIRVPLTRLQAYAQFDNEFQNDPGLRQAVLSYYERATSGQPVSSPESPLPPTAPAAGEQPQPQPTPQVVPELDLDDPGIRFLLEQQRQMAEQIRMLAGGVQATQQQVQQRQAQENDALINRAMISFRDQHGLNDQQMQDIRQAAARLNVLPSLMQGVDPITGAPSKPDPLTALDRSFEIAMMMNPTFRQQEFAREIQQRVENSKRKQKLAGLSGSSGSVPRTTPAPTSAQGRRQAMIDEIRQMQEGQWSAPES